ncbi:winged helix-turn-helix domain-containing protein [Microbulbifer halophilus]|uniref:Winged helix-turn-helix domain-containing protein n=1 Tax=Microbulbifer halophilus TaxID=453963 RepID=A0ABW5EB41_9GAMM|nr:winged helix-turn-helix domain-containing protein [Microbulbifer halophilus]MCW8126662.1 winged helix-turn-helix domain-containing protein [Microbulbifer halophilus]
MKEKNKKAREGSPPFRIGEFLFDPTSGRLWNSGSDTATRLEPQVVEFLALLVRHAGEVVGREQIDREIWPDRVVGDDAVRAMVRKLRDALGDDARNPRYIRTLPLKGYAMIAPCRETRPSRYRGPRRGVVAAAALVAALLTAAGLLWGRFAEEPGSPATVEPLTQLSGSELSPDFNSVTRRLLFSHRANKDDLLQLYTKNLDSGRVQRLTWDAANYANAHWSPDGDELVYTRSVAGERQHFLARFDPRTGIRAPQTLPTAATADKYLLGWSRAERAVYLKDEYRPQLPQGIWRLQLDTGDIEQLTAPNVGGVGDFFARESGDGAMLALLRGVEPGKRELLIVDNPTGSLLHSRILPGHPDRLAWRADGGSLVLSSFDGELLAYHLAEDDFTALNNPSRTINDAFFQCGPDCYLMRRHNGNFLDLQEAPDPFDGGPLMSTDHFDLPGAEDFPLYSADGESLYFVSRREDAVLLQRQSDKAGTETTLSLPAAARVRSLAIDPDDTYLTGLVDKRVFLFDLAARQLRYLTTEMDLAGPPGWSADGTAVLYSKSEKGKPTLYRHEIAGDRQTALIAGYTAAQAVAGSQMLAVDTERRAWLIDRGAAVRQVATLPSAIPNRWQVHRGWLYYTEHSGNDAYMTRVHLQSGETQRKLLAKNRFRLNFDLHPDGARMLAVRSLLAESNLVRVSFD